VIYAKPSNGKRFVIVDAAMNDLIRPTLYDAYHDIWAVSETRAGEVMMAQDVVGPVCETGDFLAKHRQLPVLHADDLIAVMTAGAYGASQSSMYNSRQLVPEVLVRGSEWSVVRPRPTYEQMLAAETFAPWLTGE
jgi:diaminopimelate decarboxylase